jgi:hypothetical protein
MQRSITQAAGEKNRVARPLNLAEMTPGHKTQYAALSLDGRVVCARSDFDGVDGSAGQPIHGTEDMNRPDEVKFIDRRHGNDNNAAAQSRTARAGSSGRLIHAHSVSRQIVPSAEADTQIGEFCRIFVAKERSFLA